MLWSLTAGFLLGLRHALDADHLLAVATFLRPNSDAKRYARLGFCWGLGHTATILVCTSVLALASTTLSPVLASVMEGFVGLMLIVLGIHSWRALNREGIHVHVHSHGDGTRHLHAHRHDELTESATSHQHTDHQHDHENMPTAKVLAVGATHGVAGSAAISIFSIAGIGSFSTGLLYVVLFGVGTMLGMLLLTFVIALPIQNPRVQRSGWVPLVLRSLNVASVAVGSIIVIHTARFLMV